MAGSSAMSTNQGRSGLARGRRSFSLRSAVLTESRATSSQLNCRPEKSRHGFRLGSGSPRLRGWSPCSLRCSGPARFGSVGGTRFRPRAAGCRPPPGETRMIGSARSPRPHEKGDAALTLAGPGVTEAGFALPRRCRPEAGGQFSRWGPAVVHRLGPRGTRREESHPGGWGLPVGVSAAAALRAAVPAPTGRTGRRSAFQAVPALRLSQLAAVPPACGGLRRAEGPHRENCPAFPASALACRCEAGVPSLCTARRTEPYIENTRRGGCHGERRLPLPVGFRPILAGVR